MSQNKFPAGWDEEKVRRVLAFYEEQTEADVLTRLRLTEAPPQTDEVYRVLAESWGLRGLSLRLCLQPIRLLVLPVKVRPRELADCPRSDTRHLLEVTWEVKARA